MLRRNEVLLPVSPTREERIDVRISTLIATGTSVAAAAAVGSLASRPAVQSSWYARLRKPRYQPPEIVFQWYGRLSYADIAVVFGIDDRGLRNGGDARKLRAYRRPLASTSS